MTEKISPDRYGYDFISDVFLPEGKDEYWLRNTQSSGRVWRQLRPDEIEALQRNGNYCSNWGNFLVSDVFDPALIRNSNFYGLVRLGTVRNIILKYHDLCAPVGIRNSTIISCDIGDDVAVQDCPFISHYIINDGCILSCIDELQTTNHSKFGNGVLKDGEDESVRIWIGVMNEAGGRSILPFEDMIAADAFLWAAYRDDTGLTERLKHITQKRYGGRRGSYGVIGSGSVIKSCAIIKDVAIGSHAYIKGANKLKNLTILSSQEESSQVGEGVELVNGIIGYGCRVFYGSKAVRFVMGRNSNLKYGARLINSVLGDNSTVSCCEILNNLIFPMHEQHHNNSFLIASLIQGMSNMAAAATIGSNHNTRINDGEIRAKRGFWSGLAVTLKHSSCFASFTLIAKGNYQSELNIPLPFSLVMNNEHKNSLEVLPGYFWMRNIYALERNAWKSAIRDRRKIIVQHTETNYLAPDTAEEILAGIALLEEWLGNAGYSVKIPHDSNVGEYDDLGMLACRGLERSRRRQFIIKPLDAIAAYRKMLRYYTAVTIASFCDDHPELNYEGLRSLLCMQGQRVSEWVNCGGQIVPAFRVDELRQGIVAGKYNSWDEIHQCYDSWHEAYPLDKARHAWALLAAGENSTGPAGASFLKNELTSAAETSRDIHDRIFQAREKDRRDVFRKATFRNAEEMEQVLSNAGEDPFLVYVRAKTRQFDELIARVIQRL